MRSVRHGVPVRSRHGREVSQEPGLVEQRVDHGAMPVVAHVVHCFFHLSGVVSLFWYRDVLEIKEDLIVMGMSCIDYAVVYGNTALVCFLNLMRSIRFILHAAQMNVPGQGEFSLVVVPFACAVVSLMVETNTVTGS